MEAMIKKGVAMELSEMVHYSKGAIISADVISADGGSIALYAFDRNQTLGAHVSPYNALMQVIDGVAEVKIDEKMCRLNPGEAIILPAKVIHAVRAITAFKMLFTIIKN